LIIISKLKKQAATTPSHQKTAEMGKRKNYQRILKE